MYQDDGALSGGASTLKKSMTLDFSGCGSKQNRFQSLLASPDLHLLKLGSPELEKMLLQANASIVATPTPTQFIYPRYPVTEEQEAYARGFVEALAELHQGRFATEPACIGDESGSGGGSTYSTLQPLALPPSASGSCLAAAAAAAAAAASAVAQPQQQTVATQQPPMVGVIQQGRKSAAAAAAAPAAAPTPMMVDPFLNYASPSSSVKEEPQTVPSCSPPTSPLDMEDQERQKLDRKRARNRIAARKCRTRKMERISRLEEKVADLKNRNAELASTATSLHDQLAALKQQIGEHVSRGCKFSGLP